METELLFEMSIELEPPLLLAGTPLGDRVIIYVKGGKFKGPRLSGEILPGGADWLLTRSDGVSALDVRIVLKTGDGDLIYMTYNGVARPQGAGLAIRIAPMFSVSKSSKYAWLNALQAVGEGEGSPAGVTYRVYEIK